MEGLTPLHPRVAGIDVHRMLPVVTVLVEASVCMERNRLKRDTFARKYAMPSATEHIEWCRAVLKECEALDSLELTEVEKKAPKVFEQLLSDASPEVSEGGEVEEEEIMRYLNREGGMDGYLKELRRYCLNEVEKAKDLPLIKKATLLEAGEQQLFNIYEGRLAPSSPTA